MTRLVGTILLLGTGAAWAAGPPDAATWGLPSLLVEASVRGSKG